MLGIYQEPTSDKKFTCEACGHGFTLKNNYYRHKQHYCKKRKVRSKKTCKSNGINLMGKNFEQDEPYDNLIKANFKRDEPYDKDYVKNGYSRETTDNSSSNGMTRVVDPSYRMPVRLDNGIISKPTENSGETNRPRPTYEELQRENLRNKKKIEWCEKEHESTFKDLLYDNYLICVENDKLRLRLQKTQRQ